MRFPQPAGLVLFASLALAGLGTPAFAVDIPHNIAFDGTAPIEAEIATSLGGKIGNGVLVVESTTPQDGKKTSYDLDTPGTRAVSVDVQGIFNPDPNGPFFVTGPGLVIKDDGKGYLFFAITKDGYVLRAIANGTVAQSLTGSLPSGVQAGEPVRLSAREKDAGAEFFINGESVGSIDADGVTGHGMGIIYLGRGTFTFDNLAMNSEGEIQPGGPSLVATTPPAPGPTPAPGPVTNNPPPAPGPTPAPTAVVTPPALPPPLPSVTFFVADNGKPAGPLTLEEVEARIKSGAVSAQTLVWKAGTPNWVAANTIPELAADFGH